MSFSRYKEGSNSFLNSRISVAVCGVALFGLYFITNNSAKTKKVLENSQTSLFLPNNETNYIYWQTEIASHIIP